MAVKYRVVVTRLLEDGTEVEIANTTDFPWFVSPLLKAIGRQVYEPAPAQGLPGQAQITWEPRAA